MGDYQSFVKFFAADYVMLSGWLKLVQGLDPRKTVNIHPGPLPEFGGPGMYGHFVHEAVMKAYCEGKIKQSAVTMHFVIDRGTDKKAYDKGPIIFQYPVLIRSDDTPETLAKRVNEKERAWQAYILDLVVHHRIWLEGDGPDNREVFHNCLELAKFIPGRYLPPGCEIHNTPPFWR
jgi:phosphoribosylglycinamide formyltransferase-1